MSPRLRKPLAAALAAMVLGGGMAQAETVTVINMIPNNMSGETNQDSEPSLAVNPADTTQMAASAFTPDTTAGSTTAPIYVSTDGGLHWTMNPNILNCPDGVTADITLRFSGSGGRLYAGIIPGLGFLRILRTDDFTQPTPMTVLVKRDNDDQPWVAATTVIGQSSAGKDRVYVGNNDHNAADFHTATIDVSPDGVAAQEDPAPTNFVSDRLEDRGMTGTDRAPVRIATHPDGTVYAIYYGVTGEDMFGPQTIDAVVVRDDNWGVGAQPFTALKDSDMHFGIRIAKGLTIPLSTAPLLGSERIGGGGNSIAVDPRKSDRVYAAYSDEPTSKLPYVLHVRRSDSRGATWVNNNTDLLTVNNAINPTLAVNVKGEVGILYQQLTAAKIWETHLRRSTSLGAVNSWNDIILAKFPDGNPFGLPPYLGDYAHLMAVGKDFYGVFSSSNQPDKLNFPQDVIYQRNVDWNGHVLKNNNNAGGVQISIDPFFVHVAEQDPGDDFYVRDWTDDPATGDNGAEPSTRTVFYKTSDVWNRRSTDPGMFPNDRPDNEDAGNGDLTKGDNWAFARIRRKAGGSAQDVTAHFLVSKFGVGSPYVDSTQPDADASFLDSDPVVHFAAGVFDPQVTIPYHWHLNQVASKHLCLAVEIKSAQDPFVGPSLRGSAPGWPTDLILLNDNNRAQRNMFLTATPAKPQPGMKKSYAILHNMATFPRDMTLQYTLSDPKRLNGATWRVVASSLGPVRATDPLRLASGGSLVVKAMQPEEDRWLEISIPAPAGAEGEELDVQFQEVAADQLLDGFGVGARLASNPKTIADLFENHRSVYTRLAALYPSDYAVTEMKAPQPYLDAGSFADTDYLRFLSANLKIMANAYALLSRSLAGGDPFGTKAELDNLTALYTSGAPVAGLLVSHATVLDELDALLTQQRQMKGDRADILQNVRWQRDLFLRSGQLAALAAAGSIVDASRSFIDGYGDRTLNDPDYPVHLRTLLDSLRQVAGALEPTLPGLTAKEQAIEAAVASGDLTAMQKAHRDFLAQLAALDSVL
jgi:hypothetical protein